MSDHTFRCRLVTPAESLIDEPVLYANVPLWDGLMGFQHGRAPIVARLGLGELTLHFSESTHGGGDRSYFIEGGFVQMAGNELVILAEKASPAETLTETDAQRELDEADKLSVQSDAADKLRAADDIAAKRNAARTKLRIARHARGSGRGI
ncbi:MAG: F0F1 ATP synthase subunit epsilon [Planctomycetota bacterium]